MASGSYTVEQADAEARRRHRRNNFDAIRLFAAMVVIYGHGVDLTGGVPPGFWSAPIASLGPDIFFSISGYLITRSWDLTSIGRDFALKRALRILPGLAACVLLTTFVLGPIITDRSPGAYFLSGETWAYLANIALYLQLTLPGVFPHLRHGSPVNGSLWSLLPEALCYLTVPAMAVLGPRSRKLGLLLVGIAGGCAALYLFQAPHAPVIRFYSMTVAYGLRDVPFFFVGALLSLLDHDRNDIYRFEIAVPLFVVGWWLAERYGWWAIPIEWFALPYLVMAVGRRSAPVLNRASAAGDLSYGTYLYAFPLQQVLVQFFPGLAHPVLCCAILVLPLAWLSWHLVERPMILMRVRLAWVADGFECSARQADAWVWAAIRSIRVVPGLTRTPALPLVVAGTVLLAYLGQLQMGRWQTDEYQLMANQAVWGWHILPSRLSYSPRPFSELLLFAYGWMVLHLHAPLVAPFLGVLWLGSLATTMAALFWALPRSPWRLVVSMVLPVALFSFVLVTGPVTEFFFWPVAAAAYMPTAVVSLILLFLLSRPPAPARDIASGAALLAGALSSEMGAAFAIGFAIAAAVEAVTRRPPARTAALHSAWYWAVPALAGLGVMVQIAHVRLRMTEFGAGSRSLTGHKVAAALASFGQLVRDLVGFTGFEGVVSWLPALALKLLFAIGIVATWRWAAAGGARLGRQGAVLACALLAAAFFSLYGAYEHYGFLCCERQSVTRFWMFDILAIIVVAALPVRLVPGRVGPALLALSLLPVLWRIGGISADYRNLHFATEARMKTWVSAAKPGGTAMQFYLPPDGTGLLIRGTSQPIGQFHTGGDTSEMIDAVGRFFHRGVVDVCEPWQTGQSWLYYGHFIPACPPHGGPPDRIYPPPG